jgi:iron-sulfur cluster repair protein YtfE (RIC family)
MSDTASVSTTLEDDALANTLVRDLVEAYPSTMAVLAPLGIDLCCGGSHPLGEALSLHGFDQATVLPRIAGIIQASSHAPR